MQVGMVMKQFKLNILRLHLSEIFESREITTDLQNVSKNFSVGVHSDVYEPVWYKLDILIDTTKL